MALSLFDEDVQLNEHEIAWKGKDWNQVQSLSDSFKEKAENEMFSLLNDITFGKRERYLGQSENYSKFWVDTSLSQHVDCMIAVNAMNLVGSGLSDQAHFNYYLHSIPKGKRFGKWAKFEDNSSDKFVIHLLMKYHTINADDARMYLDTYKAKGHLASLLKKMKGLVTDEFVKTVTKNVKEQKQFKKLALEW
ncbi:clamp loader small subunit [Serratia phage X20]|uniref:Sliding-clamp-loader small subunit n=3 Tax=Winklervirus TaxID=2560256 RepID=A0A1Z1LYV8_9CAUD|nr:clamp loader of DNA polymerase [Serratia phage CHI14]YP_010092199.1 clamp loader of DNA polymerase [Serratia phage X20]ARW57472.1 clamp loader small subunit [Serratia phage CHI14]ARW57747.1 clamp loader small subunit [Serratia phage CBH8]ARW58021.1 clamp loader small subunit [Serratia phage X20]